MGNHVDDSKVQAALSLRYVYMTGTCILKIRAYILYIFLHIKSDWPHKTKKWWDSPRFSWLGQMSEPSRQLVVPFVCVHFIFPSRENWSSSWAEVWWFCWWKNTLNANLGWGWHAIHCIQSCTCNHPWIHKMKSGKPVSSKTTKQNENCNLGNSRTMYDTFAGLILYACTYIHSLKLTVRPWKLMIGRWFSFWDGLFSEVILVSGRIIQSTLLRKMHTFRSRGWRNAFIETGHQLKISAESEPNA